MPEWVEMGCQFSALTYKNICLYKSSLWITILELTLTILVAVFFIKFGHDTTTVKHFLQTNINLEIKPHFTYMPDTATLTKMVNVRWKNPTHFKAVSSLAEKPLVVFRDLIDKEGLPHDLKFRVVLYEKVPTQKVIGTSYNYANKGLISAQLVVSELYLNHWKKERANLTYNPILLLKTQMMPQIQVERDVNIQRLTLLCPYLPAILLFFCVFTTALIVEEKVSNIKKTLKMLGLRQPVYWGSWFVARLCFGLIVALIVAVSWSAKTADGPLFQMYFISLYGLMLLMVINSLTFSLTLSSFLNDGSLAGLYALIAFTGANAISKMIESRAGIWTNHFVGTLLFSHGIRKCFDSMCASEMQCEGDQDNLLQEFVEGLVYMLLNTVVNTLMVCVVERTGCGEGRSLFYRCWNKKRLEEDKASIHTITQHKDEYFEPFQENAAAGIVIRDLVKMYGQTMVVAGVSLDIYTNQITTLLGHDGAGKTTLISMILGLTPITRGQVMIDGMDVAGNMTAIRKTLGFCPQHDLFFPRLTVYEHMVFYTKMRHDSITKNEAYQLLTELNLERKMSTNPLLLTDGQKRKVSIACAFAGNTKTIFLDEPSTGLDPSSRRRLWRCLLTWRSGRTILMTTHSMDEADYLSDRVAIMANGVVECCGTPMFLKKTYGVGYKLTLVKAAKCKVKKVVQYILNAEEAAIFKSSTNTELVFLLPEFCVSAFPKFLQDLEEDLHLLRIQSYGLSTTSIEDVFLKIWELDQSKIDSEDVDPDETDLNDAELSLSRANLVSRGGVGEGGRLDTDMDRGEGESKHDKVGTKNTGIKLKLQQLKALFIKRWIVLKRNWFVLTVLSCAMMLMALTLNMVSYLGRKEFPLDFQLGVYKNIIVVAAQPEDDGLKTLYSGLRSVLPTEVQVIEPDRSKTFEKFLQDWARNNSIKRYREELFMGFEINKPPSPSIVYYQGYYVHSEPVAVNIFLNAHIRAKLGFEYSLESGVIPCSRLLGDHDSQVYSLLIIQLAFFSLQTIIICWLIKERVSGTKKMESFTGVPIWLSWLTNFLFDLGLHVTCAAILWACLLTQRTVQELTTQLPLLVCSQLLFVLDALPFCYLYQMLFVRSTTAVFVLIVFTLLDFFVYVDLSDVPESDAIAYTRLVLKSASPHTLFWYHQDLLQYPTLQDAVPVFYKNVPFTFIHAIACWILLFAVEYISVLGIVYRCIQRYMTRRIEKFGRGVEIPTAMESDEDVYQERQRILHSGFDDLIRTDALILVNVSKKYIINTKVLTAVENTCLGIPKNECFGLLGQNGAGKTTIFKILTGEYASTSGHVYFNGLSLDSNLSKIHQMMGYCPESDLLCEDLTGRESLYLFGRLRGVPESSLKAVTDDLLKAVLLEPHADEKVEYYSLGNKRKLSTALAVIGDPQFVMLDEPTSGMDAMAKRAIWDLLQNVRSLGSTLVLTSHSMEECELLCTRLTIMVGGKLMCLGSPQHLKTKYAQGYTITVHLKPDSGVPIQGIIDNMLKIFNGAQVFGQMDTYLHLQIPADSLPLSSMFKMMEKAKKDMNFEHYTIQQTSLEQVFLMFMNKNKTTSC